MNTTPFCSCMKVVYQPEHLSNGAMRERWVCVDCGTEFVKRTMIRQEFQRLESDLRAANELVKIVTDEHNAQAIAAEEFATVMAENAVLKYELKAATERAEKAERKELAAPSGSALVVCLCGSSRWPELHHRLMMEETLAGNIVIPMGLYGHADYPPGAKAVTNDGDESNAVKQMLDRLHYQKIDLADEIIVVSENGYLGSSTRREIAYAQAQGKRVRYWKNAQDHRREKKEMANE